MSAFVGSCSPPLFPQTKNRTGECLCRGLSCLFLPSFCCLYLSFCLPPFLLFQCGESPFYPRVSDVRGFFQSSISWGWGTRLWEGEKDCILFVISVVFVCDNQGKDVGRGERRICFVVILGMGVANTFPGKKKKKKGKSRDGLGSYSHCFSSEAVSSEAVQRCQKKSFLLDYGGWGGRGGIPPR